MRRIGLTDTLVSYVLYVGRKLTLLFQYCYHDYIIGASTRYQKSSQQYEEPPLPSELKLGRCALSTNQTNDLFPRVDIHQ